MDAKSVVAPLVPAASAAGLPVMGLNLPSDLKQAAPAAAVAAASAPATAAAPALRPLDKKVSLYSSKDGKADQGIEMPLTYAEISTLVKTAAEGDPKYDDLKDVTSVPLSSITTATLKDIVDYLLMCKGVDIPKVEMPLRSKVMKDVTSPEAAKFIDDMRDVTVVRGGRKGSQERLNELILGANYMDIKGLLFLTCAKVASQIKGQPLDKIKEILSDKAVANPVAAASAADVKSQ
jgi:hypothetical protein